VGTIHVRRLRRSVRSGIVRRDQPDIRQKGISASRPLARL
jgi:hypothetical protein